MNKKLKNIISKNNKILENSSMDFEALYNVTFQNSGIMAEENDGFRILTYTYAQIMERIEEMSCAIHEKLGATHNYIAIEMENCVDWIVTFWAVLRSGNKPYLVNCRHPEALANSALNTLNIKYILGTKPSVLNGEFINISTLKTSGRFDGDFENEIALSTSATSLREVICFYTGTQLSAQILNVKTFIYKYPEIASTYEGAIKNLAFLPFYHIFGLIAVYFWFTFFGQTIVFMKNYSADTILKTCRKHKVTHIFAVPLLWHTIENAVLKKVSESGNKKIEKLHKGINLCTNLQNIFPHLGMRMAQKIMKDVTNQLFGQSVRFCISGGSYVRQSALELMNGLGYNLHNGYGMSEIGITSVDLRTRPKHKNLNSIGKPFSSVEYKINEGGLLSVKGTSICHKLWINGEEQPMDIWFDTGDNMVEENGYYYIKGRVGDMIIGENGENINPDIIEQNFMLPEADNFSILGLENDGKKVVALVVQLSKYMSTSKRNALLDKIIAKNEVLPMTSRVQKIYYTTDPICSENAVKTSRSYLTKAINNGDVKIYDFKKDADVTSEDITYNEDMLITVKTIVANKLNISVDDVDTNAHIMLDLGADSMQYFSIISALAEEFSISNPEKGVLYYTVHEFCQYIERHI